MFGLFATQDDNLPLMPVLPVLGGSISLLKPNNIGSILDNQVVQKVTSGAAAIYLALKAQNIKSGDQVMIPAYHCPAMVEPIINIGATPVFYAITKNIGIDIDDIKRKVNSNTKAILVPHFFGVRQDISKLKQHCKLANHIAVIEDCAHSFFMLSDSSQTCGDYIVGSLTKFFPAHDGGVLAANTQIPNNFSELSLAQELKATYNAFHDAVRYGRLKSIGWLFNIIDSMRPASSDSTDQGAAQGDVVEHGIDSEYEDQVSLSASKICKYIVDHSDYDKIIKKRQQNYRYIIEELKEESNIDLDLNCTADNFIPYMVIGRLLNPETHHPRLISNRLPVWRWEHIYESECKVAKEYSKSIIQIPCHQQLSEKELSVMVDGIKQSLRGC